MPTSIFVKKIIFVHMLEKEKQKFIVQFGKNLRDIRKIKEITQAQLAADTNMEISQISRIERGVVNTSLGNMYILAKVLKVPLSDLVKDL